MTRLDDPVEFIGPIEHYAVVAYGRSVPYLIAHPKPGGQIALTLDNRFGIDLTVQQAQTVIPFIADCIAVAMGYSGFPRDDEGLSDPPRVVPWPRMQPIDLDPEAHR